MLAVLPQAPRLPDKAGRYDHTWRDCDPSKPLRKCIQAVCKPPSPVV